MNRIIHFTSVEIPAYAFGYSHRKIQSQVVSTSETVVIDFPLHLIRIGKKVFTLEEGTIVEVK